MSLTRFLGSATALAMAGTLTAGTMYITVHASVSQEAAELGTTPSEVPQQPLPEDVATPAPQAAELAAGLLELESVSPEEIAHGRSHDVVLDNAGAFTGRLSQLATSNGAAVPAAELPVRLVQKGQTIATATTDVAGRFRMEGASAGVASLIVWDDQAAMLYSIRLVSAEESSGEAPGAGPEFDVDSAVVSGVDVGIARDLIMNGLVSEDVRFSGELAEQDNKFHVGSGPGATSVSGHRVQLQPDGSLQGEVSIMDERTGKVREVLDMTVHFIQGGREVVASEVDRSGKFVVSGLTPGLFSVVGTGRDGVFAVGVDVLGSAYEPDSDPIGKAGEFKPAFVSQSLQFSVSAVGPANFDQSSVNPDESSESDSTPPPGSPAPFGGPGGGGAGGVGGGGAGVGGGGGLGALLAGVAGGIAGFAAGDDDDDPATPGN